MKIIFFLVAMITMASCDKKGKDAFSFLEVPSSGTGETDPCKVTSRMPSSESVRLPATTGTMNQFLVQTSGKNCTSTFRLNGSEVPNDNGVASFDSALLLAGNNTLTATVANTYGSETVTWQILKNTPAACLTQTPSDLNQSVAVGGSIQYRIVGSDSEGDAMLISWKYNGQTNPILTSQINFQNGSEVSFTPAPANGGQQTIAAEIYDGYDTTSCEWNTTVTGDCSITSYIPNVANNTVRVLSKDTDSETFVVNTVTAGCTVEWRLNGSVLPTTLPTQILTSNRFSVGMNNLEARVGNGSPLSQSWVVIKNSPPVCETQLPNPANTTDISTGGSQIFEVTPLDANGDTLTYNWKLNNQTVSPSVLLPSIAGGTAKGEFTPSSSYVGSYTIEVEVNDGWESAKCSWPTQVLPACNFLSSFPDHLVDRRLASSSTQSLNFSVTPNYPAYCDVEWRINNTTVVGSETSLTLLSTNSVFSTGNQFTLSATLTNGQSAPVTRSWNLVKNSPPVCGVPDPAITEFSINQGALQSLTANVTDSNSDTLSFQWKVNGNTSPSLVFIGNSVLSGTYSSSARFTPTASQIGANAVSAVVNDGYDSVSCSWNIDVKGDCSITGHLPVAANNEVRVLSSNLAQKTFGVTTATAGCSVDWYLNGVKIPGKTEPLQVLTSQDFTGPTNTLTAQVAYASNGINSKSWTVIKNQTPACQTMAPTNATTHTMGVGQTLTASIVPSDGNATDTFTFNWFYKGLPLAPAILSATSTASSSQGTFAPSSAEIGSGTLNVDINDSFETTRCSWPVEVIPACSFASSTPSHTVNQRISAVNVSTRTFNVSPNIPACGVEWLLDGQSMSTGTSAYVLSSTNPLLADGIEHSLVARLNNTYGSIVDRTWTIMKNRVPICQLGDPTGSSVSANEGIAKDFRVDISDADNDAFSASSFQWTIGGQTDAALTPVGSTASSATARLLPTAALIGARVVSLKTSDGYDDVMCAWNVNVQGDCSITNYSPNVLGNNVRVLSPGPTSNLFSVETKTPGCSVTWAINGENQPDTSAIQSFFSSQFSLGNNTLTATVENATGTKTRSWTVVRNRPPSCLAQLPSGTQTIGLGQTLPLSLTADDQDGDTINYSWRLNNIITGVPKIADSSTGTSANAIFTPSSGEVGANTVSAVLNDGYETQTCSWPVQVLPACDFVASSPDYLVDQRIASVSPQIKTFTVTPNNPGSCQVTWFIDTTKNVGTGTTYSLSADHPDLSAPGTHSLTARLTNGYGSTVSRTWNLVKNTPPICVTPSPAFSSVIVNEGATRDYSVSISDANSDTLTMNWTLNGQTDALLSVVGMTANSATGRFAPNASKIGTNTVTLTANDGYDSVACSWNTTVQGDCSITSFSPNVGADNVRVLSLGSQTNSFQVATQTPGCPVTWKINNNPPLGSTDPTQILNSSQFSLGSNQLTATVPNGGGTLQKSWTVVRNTPPSCGTMSPVNTSTQTIGLGQSLNLGLLASDVNSDPVTFAWKLNGMVVSNTILTGSSTDLQGNLTFTPGSAQVGANSVSAEISDGLETTLCSWPVQVLPACDFAASTPSHTVPQRFANQRSQALAFSVTPNNPASCTVKWFVDNDTEVGSESLLSLDSMDDSLSSGTNHTLTARITNGFGSTANRTWQLVKNSIPVCTSPNPVATSVSLNQGNSGDFSASVSDADAGETFTYAWRLNGANNGSLALLGSTATSSTARFTPTLSQIGANTVSLVIDDGFDAATCAWTTNVQGDCSITSVAPSLPDNKVRVLSPNGTINSFQVYTRTPGCSVTWTINGTVQSGTETTQLFNSEKFQVGGNSLVATVTNATDTASYTWNVIKNSPPRCDTMNPLASVSNVIGLGESINLALLAADNDSDSVSMSWKLNGATVAPSILAGNSTGLNATAVFTPSSSQVGANSVSVLLNDSYESAACSWPVQVLPACDFTDASPNPLLTHRMAANADQTKVFSVTANHPATCEITWYVDSPLTVLADGPLFSLNSLSSSLAADIPHTVIAQVTNGYGSTATKTWNIVKNKPPVCSGTTPSSGSVTVNQDTNNDFTGAISDADTDAGANTLTFLWKLNGVAGDGTLSTLGSTSTQSTARFTPTSAKVGNNILSLTASDTYDTAICSWNVNVQGDCSLTSFSPNVAGNTIRILSSNSVNNVFQVTPRTAGCPVTWKMNGVTVGTTDPTQLFTSGEFGAATTLVASVANASGVSSQTWYVTKNSPPSCGSMNPSNASTQTIGYGQNIDLALNNVTDINGASDVANLTFQWKLNGASVGSTLLSTTTNGASSSANFNPTLSQVGTNLVEAQVNDGYETSYCSWNVQVMPPCDFTSVSPAIGNTVKIASVTNETKTFSASSNNPATCTIKWYLNTTHFESSGPVYGLNSLNTELASGTTHTLTAEVSNGFGTPATRTWNIVKNRAPTCALTNPSVASTSLFQTGTKDFQTTVSDNDVGDTFSFSWALNGSTTDTTLALVGSTSASSTARFSPNVSKVGNNVVTVFASDGYDTAECSWNATVQGDCGITSFSPTLANDEVRILSTNSALNPFSVTTATMGCSVDWFINNSPTALADHENTQVLSSGQFSAGNNTLTAKVTNPTGITQKIWSVIRNTPPSCGTFSPLNTSTQTIGFGESINLSLTTTETNTDPLTVIWKLNGVQEGASVIAASLNQSGGNYTATGNFTPRLTDVGANTVTAVLSDGYETQECSWPIQVLPPCEFVSSTPDHTVDTRIASITSQTKTFTVTPNNPTSCSVSWHLGGQQITTVPASSTTFSLNSSSPLLIGGSTHTLMAKLTNNRGSEVTRSWTIKKNAVPVCATYGHAQTFSMTAGDTPKSLSMTMTDGESDPLSFAWSLNGINAPEPTGALTTNGINGYTAYATFAPTMANVGSNTLSANVSDGYDTVACSWNATVTGNCAITNNSPSNASPIKIGANGLSYIFSVTTTASGCPVSWYRGTGASSTLLSTPDSVVSLASSQFVSGGNTLRAVMSNGSTTSEAQWTVNKNIIPALEESTATNAVINMTLSQTKDFYVRVKDYDLDALNAIWKIDGQPVSNAILNPSVTVPSAPEASYYFNATFAPTETYSGSRRVSVVVNDGTDYIEFSWDVMVYKDCSVASFFPSTTQRISKNGTTTTTFGVVPNDSSCQVTWVLKTPNDSTVATNSNLYTLVSQPNVLPASSTLVATLSNGQGTPATKSWTITQNSPPLCTAGQSPVATGNEMLYSETLNLSSGASDAENDPLTFKWTFNNTEYIDPVFTNIYIGPTNTVSSSFHPNSGMIGNNQTVASKFYDQWDNGYCQWNVRINDDQAVQIQACVPTQGTVVLLSKYPGTNLADIKNFAVSATGPEIFYRWKESGNIISGLNAAEERFSTTALAANTYNGSSPDYVWATGSRSLVVEVVDKYANVKNCTWQLKRNTPPYINTSAPGTVNGITVSIDGTNLSPVPSNIRFNYASVLQLSVNASDFDADDASQLIYRWQIDGQTIPVTGNGFLTYTVNSGRTASTAYLNPDFNTLYLGNKTITAEISDGYESVTYSWNINVNMFSAECNTLYNSPVTPGSGKVCTIVGQWGVGGNREPLLDPTTFRMQPSDVIFDNAPGLTNNLIFADLNTHSVFYYNRGTSASDDISNRFGKAIPHGQIVPIVGLGISGITADKSTPSDPFKLSFPKGLAVSGDRLYIADANNHRVVMVTETGVASSFLGRVSNNPNPTTFTKANNSITGAPGTGQICLDAWDVEAVSEGANTFLYVTCRYSIKKIDITNPTNGTFGYAYLVVGRPDGVSPSFANPDGTGASNVNAIINGGYEDGYSVSSTGAFPNEARAGLPRAMAKDGNGNIYWTEREGRLRVLNRQATNLSLFPARYLASVTTIFARDLANGNATAYTSPTTGSAGSVLQAVDANNNVATKIAVYGPSVIANTQCAPIRLQLQNSSNLSAISAANVDITVTTTNGNIRTASDCLTNLPSSKITLTAGQSSVEVWLEATNATNAPVITATATGLTAGSRTITNNGVSATAVVNRYAVSAPAVMHFNNCERVWVQALDASSRPITSVGTAYASRIQALNGGTFYAWNDSTCSGTPVSTIYFDGTAKSYQQGFLFYSRATVVTPGRVATIFGNPATTIGNTLTNAFGTNSELGAGAFNGGSNASHNYQGTGLAVNYSGSNIFGFFLSNNDNSSIAYINNLDSNGQTVLPQLFGGGSTVLGGTTFGGSFPSTGLYHQYKRVIGNGTSTYNGDSKIGTNSRISNINGGLIVDQNNEYLYVGDSSNWRLRRFKIASGAQTGVFDSELGIGRTRSGGGTDAPIPATDATMNEPNDVLFDASKNLLFISDLKNGRIRTVDTLTGTFQSYAGRGVGDHQVSTDDRFNFLLGGPQQMALVPGSDPTSDFLVFTDSRTQTANTNPVTAGFTCTIKALNRSPSRLARIFGEDVASGNISNILGDPTSLGCSNTIATSWFFNSNSLNSTMGNPTGLVSDGTNLYVSDPSANCIVKIDANNNMTNFIGQCGSADATADGYGTTFNSGNTSFPVTPTRVTKPTFMAKDPQYPQNFFYIDGYNQLTATIHYANTTQSDVPFAHLSDGIAWSINPVAHPGTPSGANVRTTNLWSISIASGHASFNGIAAFDKWVCISAGGQYSNSTILGYTASALHGVWCFDRTDPGATAVRIVGAANTLTSPRAGTTIGYEHELKAGTQVQLYQPTGLTFDTEGNLYIAERGSHVIRMVRRWW